MLTNRVIIAIALTQIAGIVIGFFTLRLFTYPVNTGDPGVQHFFHPHSWSAKFLRSYGWMFIAIPILWLPYSLAAKNVDRGWFSADAAILIGSSLAIVLALWFIITAFGLVFRF